MIAYETANSIIIKDNDIIKKYLPYLEQKGKARFDSSTECWTFSIGAKKLFPPEIQIIPIKEANKKSAALNKGSRYSQYQIEFGILEKNNFQFLQIDIFDEWLERELNLVKKIQAAKIENNGFNSYYVPKCHMYEAWVNCYCVLKENGNSFLVKDNAKKVLKELLEKQKLIKEIVASKSKEYNGEIPKLKLPLYNYQKEDINFLLTQYALAKKFPSFFSKGSYLGNDMGTGKTPTSIAFSTIINKKVIVVCTKFLKDSWANEIEKFTEGISYEIVEGRRYKIQGKDFIIINYDIIKFHVKELINFSKDRLVICDESQKIANQSQRTKATLMLCKNAELTLLMSGTPINTKVRQLWYQMVAINKENELAPSFKIFRDRFSNTRTMEHKSEKGYTYKIEIEKEAKEVKVLQRYMQPFFSRKRKSDVKKDMPPITRRTIEVNLSNHYSKEYDKAKKTFVEWMKEQDPQKVKDMLARGQGELKGEALMKLGALRKITSEGKKDSSFSFVQEFIEEETPLIVFGFYRDSLTDGYNRFKQHSSRVMGGVGSSELKKWLKGETLILWANHDSGGEGLNLVKSGNKFCTNMLFHDQPLFSAKKRQCEDRIHRGGQEEPVTIHNLLAKKTIDIKLGKNLVLTGQKLAGICGDNMQEAAENALGEEALYGILSEFCNY